MARVAWRGNARATAVKNPQKGYKQALRAAETQPADRLSLITKAKGRGRGLETEEEQVSLTEALDPPLGVSHGSFVLIHQQFGEILVEEVSEDNFCFQYMCRQREAGS